jgi:hypothetical protein
MKGMRDLGTGCECDRPDCPRCGPLVAVAKMIREEFERTTRQARVPTPEIVWWRAQMRAREDAARAAARPILFTQALAIAAVIGLLISVAGRLTLPALSWTVTSPLSGDLPLLPIAIAAGCWLVLAPLALYLAFARE